MKLLYAKITHKLFGWEWALVLYSFDWRVFRMYRIGDEYYFKMLGFEFAEKYQVKWIYKKKEE